MARTACCFCRRKADRAREHVWPQWLQDALNCRADVRALVHRSFDGGVSSRRIQNTASMILGGVCAKCNNEWMSELETHTVPVVTLLLSELGNHELTSEDAATLALWSFKTAIVLNASSNYRRIVPDTHFWYLHDTRSIPAGVFIDVARIGCDGTLSSRQSQHFMGMVNGSATDALEEMRASCYNILLGIASFGIRVAHLPLLDHHVVSDLEQPDRTRRLWPSTTEPVSLDFGAIFQNLEEFEMALSFAPSPT